MRRIDVAEARKILKSVQEACLAKIAQAQREAVSVLLQVLYSLHQGHVRFLIGDYTARVLDTHGPDAFPKSCARSGHLLVCSQHSASRSRHDQRRRRRDIPRIQVCLLSTPVVVKRTRLTPPSPPAHR
jgi:hypothetical protein